MFNLETDDLAMKPYILHTYTNVYFNEFVANVLRDNIRPKTPLRGQKWHEGVDLLEKVFNITFSTTSKTP